jgi:3-hydroxyisobutyrate dehydrogenase-like beta-hydroxyacid dehydrogenase
LPARPACRGLLAALGTTHFKDKIMANIAFLGCGLLGSAFAEAAALRGDHVSAWNRSPDKARALTRFGVRFAASTVEAVDQASRVHLVLKDDAAVEDVLAAAKAGLAPGAVLIDHSTTLPALTLARAARLQAEGLNYLHCPVFMGPAAARAAQGSMLAAGPQALFERVQPELQKMTQRLEFLGERTDLAAVNKLFGNTMIIGLSALVADILTLAQASQVSPEEALRLLGFFDLDAMVGGRGANMAKGNFNPSFELQMARKDVGLITETAAGRPLAVLPSLAARMDQLIAAGHGSADFGVLAIDALQPKL